MRHDFNKVTLADAPDLNTDVPPLATCEDAYRLTVSKIGPQAANGYVRSNPPGIDLGLDGKEYYSGGTTVELFASALSGTAFLGCSGDCVGTGLCRLTMISDKNVKAKFGPPPTHKLRVTVNGKGVVYSDPPGIKCKPHCRKSYDHGTLVKLLPAASSGSFFRAWSGSCRGVSVPCEVVMNRDQSVNAKFDKGPPPQTSPQPQVPAPQLPVIVLTLHQRQHPACDSNDTMRRFAECGLEQMEKILKNMV